MIVDSCIDPSSGRAASLDYLKRIGVDAAKQVVAVMATHWHDDHVRGLAQVLKACEGARFFCSSAFRSDEFLTLTQSYVLGAESTTSGVREFGEVLGLLRDRKASGNLQCGPSFVLENRLIESSNRCEIKALSPSSAAIEKAMSSIASLLPEQQRPHLRVAAPTPNEGSVALWLEGRSCAALLSADVERQASDDRGWGAILALAPGSRGRAGIVKVAHHGSESGHDQRVWDELLVQEPQAFLTPWRRGSRGLPTPNDRSRIVHLAPEAIQVGRIGAKPKRYDPTVERVLKEVTQTRRAAVGRLGHTRARCRDADQGMWRVQTIAESVPLADVA